MGGGNKLPTFAGLMISPGNLYYYNGTFLMSDNWDSHCSYQISSGLVNGSSYFSPLEIAQFFDNRGSSFPTSYASDINNLGNKVSFGDYNDWRLPSLTEIFYILMYNIRKGSTVNGTPGVCYTNVYINDANINGETYVGGMLVFPDGFTVTGKAITKNSGGSYSSRTPTIMSKQELSVYLEQGCAFFPGLGLKANNQWSLSNSPTLQTTTTPIPTSTSVLEEYSYYDYDVWEEVSIQYSANACFHMITYDSGVYCNNSSLNPEYTPLPGKTYDRLFFVPVRLVRTA